MTRRDVLAFSASAATAGAAGWVGGGFRSGRPGPVELWGADRAAHEVLGLDRDGFVVRRFAVLAPVRVVARTDGGVRALSAVDLWAGGRFETVDLDARGAVLGRRPAARPPEGPRSPGGAFSGVDAPPRLAAATALLRAPRSRDRIRRVWVARSASDRGGIFVERWIERGRGPELGFRVRANGVAGTLVRGAAGGVWAIGARQLQVTAIDERGRLTWAVEVRDAEGACAAVPARGGGAWIAARGALVRLGRDGARLPGQGGFAELVDLARAR